MGSSNIGFWSPGWHSPRGSPSRRIRPGCEHRQFRPGTTCLLVVAPFASTLLALRWFSAGIAAAAGDPAGARGRWQRLNRREAELHPHYGTSGIMVSLLVGMMLNVPVRAAEYLAAMPPLSGASRRVALRAALSR